MDADGCKAELARCHRKRSRKRATGSPEGVTSPQILTCFRCHFSPDPSTQPSAPTPTPLPQTQVGAKTHSQTQTETGDLPPARPLSAAPTPSYPPRSVSFLLAVDPSLLPPSKTKDPSPQPDVSSTPSSSHPSSGAGVSQDDSAQPAPIPQPAVLLRWWGAAESA